MSVLLIIIVPLAALLALPLLTDVVNVLTVMLRRGARVRAPVAMAGGAPRLLFLVPAHNEELLIDRTLRSIADMQYPADRIHTVVVADNCTDRTAAIARAGGAECLERTDARERGKPHAIRWAMERLPLDRYAAMVVLDADSVVSENFAAAVAKHAPLEEKVVQSYTDVSNGDDNALTRMAAVFSVARFIYMNGLKTRAGLNVPLGNGIVFGSAVLQRHGWPALSITENWEMYAILTARGVPIEACPAARNLAQEARSLAQSGPQRKRWAAGKMGVLLAHAGGIVRSDRARWRQKLDTIAELASVGPVVHLGAASVLAVLTLLLGGGTAPVLLVILGLPVLRHLVYTALSIGAVREPWRAVAAFAYLPLYAGWRLAVQLRAMTLVHGTAWVRTARHAE